MSICVYFKGPSNSFKVEQMISPGGEIDKQSLITHLPAIPVKDCLVKGIVQAPRSASQITPGKENTGLGPLPREVDHDKKSLSIFLPAPGHQIQMGLIIGPAATFAESPPPFTEGGDMDHFQQPRIERLQVQVRPLIRPPAQEHRKPYLPPLELSLVKKPCARECRNGNCIHTLPFHCENSRCAGLVVVFNETDQLLLVSRVSQEVKPHTLRVFVFEAVIETLVVAIVKSLLLQFPLQVPVSLRNKPEIGVLLFNGLNYPGPVISLRSGSCPHAPGPFKNIIYKKHGHVTANAVTLACNVLQGFLYRITESRVKGIELKHVRPCREIGVLPAGKDLPFDLNE